MNKATYHQERNRTLTARLRSLQKELPPYCTTFFRGIADTTAIYTRVHYAYDIRTFFRFLIDELLPDKPAVKDIPLDALDALVTTDIEQYLDYLNLYETNSHTVENQARGKSRKLAALRTFFKYLYQRDMIQQNVTEKVNFPKLSEKPIIRLDADEVKRLLETAETGAGLSPRERKYHLFTISRDVAILTLLLGTGIRISECVGLDCNHFDFRDNSFVVTRKGGDRVVLFFGNEVAEALKEYIANREKLIPVEGHENAFFLSLQRKRMGVRTIENMVKKFSSIATPLKHITPHKLRSTFGTSLYRRTGDIYLVADVLGHADVNTTKKHYAAISEDARKYAAQQVQLREEREEDE